MKSKDIKIGFWVGLICALISLVLFSIVESVRMTLLIDDSISFGSTFSFMLPMILVYGGMFTFFPSGLGGAFLELLIRNRLEKGSLTEGWATAAGILLAGFAIMLTCGIGLSVLWLAPHNEWKFIIDDIKTGQLLTNISYYVADVIKQVLYLLPEIITVTILACMSGGIAGKYLSRKLIGSQLEAPQNTHV
ncbi:MAG: hypothetical protein ACOYYS_10095 [Chloroflexota bacterium]